MALESLMIPQSQPEADLYKPGTPDVSEAVGVTLELYKELGFAGDADKAGEDLTRDFTALTDLGYDGRLYVPVPIAISFGGLRTVVDSRRPNGVEPAAQYDPFWKPGTEVESVTEEELDTAPSTAVARIALFNVNTQTTSVDPLLHHLDLPVDEYAREKWGGNTTQEAAVEADKATFAEKHPDSALNTLNHRDYIVLAGMDRIRGIDPKSNDFILNRGWMRIPELGRRSVDGDSFVGRVYSGSGRLRFGRDYGRANSFVGVGLSAGQKLEA